jgi:hypothetical protein
MFTATLHLDDLPDVDCGGAPSVEFSTLEELRAVASSFSPCADIAFWGGSSGDRSAYLPSEAAFASFFGGAASGEELHVVALRVPALPNWAPTPACEAPLRAAVLAACARWPLTAQNIQPMAARLQGMGLHMGCFVEPGVVEKARGVVPAAALVRTAAAASASAASAAAAAWAALAAGGGGGTVDEEALLAAAPVPAAAAGGEEGSCAPARKACANCSCGCVAPPPRLAA